jgi:hypothetical protein
VYVGSSDERRVHLQKYGLLEDLFSDVFGKNNKEDGLLPGMHVWCNLGL